jgi:hypothetical protein
MSKLTYFTFVLVVAAVVLIRNGVTTTTVSVLLVAAALAAIPLYFGTRDRSLPASSTERVAATAWVWLRRVIGVGVGTLMLVAAISFAVADSPPTGWSNRWLGVLLFAFLGAFFVYVGLVGQGAKRYQWRDDVQLHRQNKRRYRWWL